MKETKGKPKKDAGPKGNASAPSQKGAPGASAAAQPPAGGKKK